jgi:uncharacterized RDD family membrane protein YckC
MDTQQVLSPAGFWRRLVALIIDGIVVGIVAGVIGLLVSLVVQVASTDLNGQTRSRGTIQFIVGLLYFTLMWASSGQTLGYMLMGIRVTRSDGAPIGWGRALIRYVLIELSFGLCAIPAIISAFMVGLSERKQGIHDLLVDTVVVKV